MPPTGEDLISRQQDLYGRIARSIENLKKRGTSAISVGIVESRLQLLDSQWQKFEAIHEQILSCVPEPGRKSPYFQNDVFGETEEIYALQKGTLIDMLSELRAAVPAVQPPLPTTGVISRSRSSLPRINLPQFSGRYQDWTAFRDLFKSLIIHDTDLSNVERLHYLKTSLVGEAAGLLKNVTTTNANFDRAWALLTSRYENKRLLVGAQVSALAAIPSMATESAPELKRLLDHTCDAISALETLQCPVTNGTYWLAHLTAERLDKRSRRDWETSLGDRTEPATFDDLKAFLQSRIRALEAIEQTRSAPDVRPAPKSLPATPKGAKSYHVAKADKASGRCSLCQRSHYVLFCPSYQAKTPVQRKMFVNSTNMCINCLGKHQVRDCQSTKTCQKCKDKHHTTLHEAYQDVATTSQPATSHLAQAAPSVPTPVLLATARVFVAAEDGSSVEARALIDPGSEILSPRRSLNASISSDSLPRYP